MRRLLLLLFCLPLALGAMDYVPRQMIVQTSQPRQITRNNLGLTQLDSYLAQHQVKEIKPVFTKADNRFYLVELTEEIDFTELENLRFSGVENIEPNYLNDFFLEPNDLNFEQQRINFENINLPQAWDYTTGNSEVLVAIIDSGLYFDHVDLQDNVDVNSAEMPLDDNDSDNNGYVDDWRGWDFVDAPGLASIGLGDYIEQDNDATDEIGHGTHLAGIIGATTNNNQGVAAALWNSNMLIIRAGFNSTLGGFLQNDDAAAAIIYAADLGADVINISWGDVNYSALIDYAITYAYNQGSIIVCAAGNEGSKPEHNITYPAKLANTICVGAVDSQKEWASFSSYGAEMDLVAPGVQIFSTYNSSGENIYYEQSGTSMAAPFVASAVALLLSVEPDLDFEAVKTRLLTTAEDLGPIGFDNKFGYGLLNTFEMLSTPSTPQVEISFPSDQSGFGQSIDIYGTATVVPESEFFRYSLTYTSEDSPASTDWQNINPGEPMYHYTPVEAGYLGRFVLQDLMPEGDYKIKLSVVTADQQHYHTIHQVTIDQSAPQFDFSRSFVDERYYDEFNRYYIGAVYDDQVDLEITESNSGLKFYSNFSDSLQIMHVPDNGFSEISLNLKATNQAGMISTESPAYLFENINKTIDTNSWNQALLEKQLIAIRSTRDFDNNGVQEIVALEIQPDSSRVAKAFEFSGDQLVEKHLFPFGSLFWPYDVGSMEEGKTHMLGITSITGNVYEASPGSDYPNVAVYSVEDCYGGRLLDTTGDGLQEAVLSRNIQVNNINYKAITISKRVLNEYNQMEYSEIDTLWNWTPTNSINAFTNQMEAADFNQNGIPTILTADADGDVMLFENGEPVWAARMPVGDIENLAIGDFDADGSMDFCVGGYNFDVSDPNRSFSFYGFFTYDQTEEDYVEMGSISFDNLEVRNSLVAADVTGDLSAEAIIHVPPNIYIVDYQQEDFVPIWKGEAAKTFKNVLVALPHTTRSSAKIIAPIRQAGNLTSSLISLAADFSGPPTPTGFRAVPADSSSAVLTWDEHDFEHIVIYRKYQDNIQEIATISGNEYIDNNLQTGQSYQYSIAGYDQNYTPHTSRSTLWKEVIPSYVPQLQTLQMCSPYELKLIFNQDLHNNSVNVQHFIVNNEIGPPASVNFIQSKRGLLLSFQQPFADLDDYQLQIVGLQGATGLPIPDGSFSFQFAEDTVSPRIVSAVSIAANLVRIHFSETMQDLQVENLDNYAPVFPLIDQSNSIVSAESGNDELGYFVDLDFADQLKFSNQSYFLKLKNMSDLAGNLISNNGNKCSFTLTEIVDLKHMIVYPNPLYLSQFEEIRFVNLPLQKAGDIRIYDLAGELVFSDQIAPLTELKNYYSWKARNSKGKRVSSGMYLYFIKVGNDFKKGKLAVIH